MKLLREDVVMPAIFRESLSIALRVDMKSFDLIHLSAAKYAKEAFKAPIQAFVTGDDDFLDQKDKLSKIADFPLPNFRLSCLRRRLITQTSLRVYR